LPSELLAFRRYNAKNQSENRVLCVMSDADNLSPQGRIASLTQGCDPAVDTQNTDRNVCFVIPRWAVETWMLYLLGSPRDETARVTPSDKRQCEDKEQLRSCVLKLKDACDAGSLPDTPPPSLLHACDEFHRITEVLNG